MVRFTCERAAEQIEIDNEYACTDDQPFLEESDE